MRCYWCIYLFLQRIIVCLESRQRHTNHLIYVWELVMIKNQKPELRNNWVLNTIFSVLVFWLLDYRLITDIMLKSKIKILVFNFSFIQNLRIWLVLDKMSRFATECACLPNAPMHHLHSSLNYLLCSVTYNGRPSIWMVTRGKGSFGSRFGYWIASTGVGIQWYGRLYFSVFDRWVSLKKVCQLLFFKIKPLFFRIY